MIKSFLSWGTALLVLCSGLLSSCDDKNEGGGNPDPTVTIAIGDAAFNALKFTLTLKDADKCSYICAKASETVPTAEQILANGKSVTASGVIEVGNLEPNTAYRLSAVAQKGNISGKVYSIEHTTSAPGVHPAVVLTPGQSTTTTLTFNAALTDPETAAYVCLEKTEGLTLPTAEEILRDGKAIAATGEILIENLKPSTTYVIAAAVANTGIYSEVNSIVMATGTPTPVVTLAAGAPGITALTFTVGLTDAEKAAYLCIEKVAGAVVPTAEKILAEGTAIAQAGEITADNLKDGTAYIIAVAASNKEVYSEVKSIEMSTDKDLSGPAVFDRQVAGGYYGIPEGGSYGEYIVVLADGETIDAGGVHATVNAGRAMSLDLFQMKPYKLDNITLPDRTYRYATSQSLSTFHPDKTYCMVNDGKGNITKVEFKAGTIAVTKSGSTFTIEATLTTTDDNEFTASYTGPITIEDKTASAIEPLPDLENDVTNATFIRALGKYYNNDAGTANDCVVNLYDVQPTVGDDYDYLMGAGHMVSLYLTTALSEEMVLQEGTYTVSDTGTPGTYTPGEQMEFMESMLATGTYCEERNASNESVYGFITSGTVTITKVGTDYRFVLDFTTDKGRKVSGTYEGAVEMRDKRR
ncbi:hypothetical protein [Alistipes onderdonkii]|uniref:hypothetical protein n=1 Tax=Alistipes onderdonkii TaxID=328813 RepID=UPI0036F30F75